MHLKIKWINHIGILNCLFSIASVQMIWFVLIWDLLVLKSPWEVAEESVHSWLKAVFLLCTFHFWEHAMFKKNHSWAELILKGDVKTTDWSVIYLIQLWVSETAFHLFLSAPLFLSLSLSLASVLETHHFTHKEETTLICPVVIFIFWRICWM